MQISTKSPMIKNKKKILGEYNEFLCKPDCKYQ